MLDKVKKFWWIGLLIALFGYYQIKLYNMQKIIDITVESSKNQIESVRKNHQEEIKKREILLETHKQQLSLLQNEFNKKSNELAIERTKKIKNIVKSFDDRKKISDKITQIYGFSYIDK